MSDNASQLIFELHKGQSQFAYFQLGVAASAIAFAVHQTANTSLVDAPWPLAVAVGLWALSFALGCFGLDARQAGILSNASFLQLSREFAAEATDPAFTQTFEEIKADVKKDLRRPATRFRWQKWTLFAGALFYIGGHVMQMAAIAPRAATVATEPTPAASAVTARQRPAPEGKGH
jgi:hypothetical protein